MAATGQQRYRDRAGPAGGAGYQHVTVPRGEARVLETQHGEHRGEAGGADRRSAAGGQGGGEVDQGIRSHPGTGREAAVAGLADPVAVEDHRVAGGEALVGGLGHGADEVDAGDQRMGAGDALPGQGHPVLVVQGGELDVQGDLAVQQGLVGVLQQARGRALGVDQDRAHWSSSG